MDGAQKMRSYLESAKRWSPVTVLIGINVAVFLFSPAAWAPEGAVSLAAMKAGKVWTLFTYMFIHGNLLHLMINCLMLYFFGRHLNQILGSRHFLWIYLAGGLIGAVAQLMLNFALDKPDEPMVGASAGVGAVMVAFILLLPDMEFRILLWFVLPIKSRPKVLLYALVGIEVVLLFVGLILESRGKPVDFITNVAHLAHLGGFFTGWYYVRRMGIVGPLLNKADLHRRRVRAERKVVPFPQHETSSGGLLSGATSVPETSIPVVEDVAEESEPNVMDEANLILDRMRAEGRQPTPAELVVLKKAASELSDP